MNKFKSFSSQVKGHLLRIYQYYRDKNLKNDRLTRAKRYFLPKQGHLTALEEVQKQEILDYWGTLVGDVKGLLGWFEFYNTYCEDKSKLKYYVPDSVFFTDIDIPLTDPRRSYELDDKNLYDLYFNDIRRPLTIVRKCNGALLDRDYQPLTVERALALCREAGTVICKPARNSQGGKGIQFFDTATPDQEMRERLEGSRDFIVQEVLHQHESLNRIHEKSINTVRIMTLFLDDEVHLLSSVLRMGRDGARVDNASSGGIFCGINADGTLKEVAYDTKGERWTQHPQGAVFKDVQIAGFDKCCDLVRQLAGRFSTTSRMISWDLAIGEDGEPVVIEMNLTFGQVDFHQMCNGPIFGERTPELLARLLSRER